MGTHNESIPLAILEHARPAVSFVPSKGTYLVLYDRSSDDELFKLPLSSADLDSMLEVLKACYDLQQRLETDRERS